VFVPKPGIVPETEQAFSGSLEQNQALRVEHMCNVRARAARDVVKRGGDRQLSRHCIERRRATLAVRCDARLKAQSGGERADHQTHRQ
jgi:hypothetical protein